MAAQRKTRRLRISAKEREFEELLRRASIYQKNRAAASPHVIRRKRKGGIAGECESARVSVGTIPMAGP